MPHLIPAVRWFVIALLLVTATACGDSTGPEQLTMASVAGVYHANPDNGEITTSQGATTTDWIAAGGSIYLELHADGGTTGQIFIPGAGEDGDLQADLEGSWSLRGSTVELSHDADTFLRDMSLQVRGDRLEGSAVFDAVAVTVVLAR